jgi:hypothetical protein
MGIRVVERLRGAFRLGIQKTLGLTSMHCIIDFNTLRENYILPEGLDDDDAELEVIR